MARASRLSGAGGVAAQILVVYSLLTIAQILVLGGPPATAAEMFDLLHRNRLVGLLRLDLPTFLFFPLYYLLFLGLWAALPRSALSALATVVAIAGVSLVLSAPNPLSMIPLADGAATGPELLRAGEAYLRSDIWHGTRPLIGGLLVETAAFMMCLAMLRGSIFGRFIAWFGLVLHGLDAAHIAVAPAAPGIGSTLLMIAGPFYPVWLFLIGYKLLKARRQVEAPTAQ